MVSAIVSRNSCRWPLRHWTRTQESASSGSGDCSAVRVGRYRKSGTFGRMKRDQNLLVPSVGCDAGVSTPRSTLRDSLDCLQARVPRGDAGTCETVAVRADATPDLDQSPVAEQILVEEDLVVASLLGIDPGPSCRGMGHAEQGRHPTGSACESGLCDKVVRTSARRVASRFGVQALSSYPGYASAPDGYM